MGMRESFFVYSMYVCVCVCVCVSRIGMCMYVYMYVCMYVCYNGLNSGCVINVFSVIYTSDLQVCLSFTYKLLQLYNII